MSKTQITTTATEHFSTFDFMTNGEADHCKKYTRQTVIKWRCKENVDHV